jgi:hypothetical protein
MSLKLMIRIDGEIEKLSDDQRRNLAKLSRACNETKMLIDSRVKGRNTILFGNLTGWDLEREQGDIDFTEERLAKSLKEIDDILLVLFETKS